MIYKTKIRFKNACRRTDPRTNREDSFDDCHFVRIGEFNPWIIDPMDDSGFLGHFWLLGNGDPSLRRSAISGILLSLRGANDKVSNKDEEKFNDSSAKHQDLVKGQNINSQDLWNFKDYHFSIPKGESESYSKPFFNALEYTMNRLIHGLSSSREAVRQGYAAALTAIFIEFPKAVPLSSVSSDMSKSAA